MFRLGIFPANADTPAAATIDVAFKPAIVFGIFGLIVFLAASTNDCTALILGSVAVTVVAKNLLFSSVSSPNERFKFDPKELFKPVAVLFFILFALTA